MEIVGPADAIATLIDLSNVAATTRLTEMQLVTLQEAFGMGEAWTKAGMVCTLWEQRSVLCLLCACYMGLICMLKSVQTRLFAVVVAVVAVVICACWYNVLTARRTFSYLPTGRLVYNVD